MCLIGFSLDAHDEYALVIAANRDEFYGREAAPAAWWPDRPDVYGGRDLRAGGGWLAVDRSGRVAAVTNVREAEPMSGPRSRGELVSGFVGAAVTPHDYAESVLEHADDYAGFNLLLFDPASATPATYVSNRHPRRMYDVGSGVHGLSNGTLDAEWPKVRRISARLTSAIDRRDAPIEAILLDALADRTQPLDEELPDTGIGADRERMLSPAMVFSPDLGYGTRASTVIVIRRDGQVRVVERSWVAGDAAPLRSGDRRARFRLPASVRAAINAPRGVAAS